MVIAVVIALALAAYLLLSQPRTQEPYTRSSGKTWITTNFNDTGAGMSGIPFDLYPITWKGKKIFPAAVHERDAGAYMYKIMKVKLPGKKNDAYLHINDVCNKCDAACRSSVQIGSKKYKKTDYRLLDIHEKAFGSGGFDGKPTNTYNPSVKVVGALKPDDIPSLPKGWYVNRCKSGNRSVNCKAQPGEFGSYCSWMGN